MRSYILLLLGSSWLALAETASLPALLQPVQEIYPTLHAGQLVVAGGLASTLPASQGQMSAAVQLFDLASRQWRSGPALPAGRHHVYLVSVGARLFAFGGFVNSDHGQWTNSADVLLLEHPGAQWRRVASMPAPLSETTGAVINGKIHLAGGRSPQGKANGQWQHSTDVNWHWVFDPDRFTFSAGAPLPSPRNSAATVTYQGRWIMLGGRTVGGSNLTEVLEYLPATDQWRVLPALPQGRAGHAAAVLQDKVWVFGGETAQSVLHERYVFDLKSERWHSAGHWPAARHGLGAVASQQQIWLIGGATAAGLAQTSDRLDSVSPGQHAQ